MPRPRLSLAHVTLAVRDVDAMAAFYADVLGFVVTDRGEPVPGMGEMVFMSQDPAEHHQIVLVSAPEPPTPGFSLADHMAFRTGSLDDLRDIGRRLDAAGTTGVIPISHGNAWSLYFTDPEGNGVECFVDTPFHLAQPYADGLDLSLADDDVAATTRAAIETHDGFAAVDDWRREHIARIDARA